MTHNYLGKRNNIICFGLCLIMTASLAGCSSKKSEVPDDPYAYLADTGTETGDEQDGNKENRNPATYKHIELPECTPMPELEAPEGSEQSVVDIVKAHNEFAAMVAQFKNGDLGFLNYIDLSTYYKNNIRQFLIDYPEVFDAYRQLAYETLEFVSYYDIEEAKPLTVENSSELVFCVKHSMGAYYIEDAFAKANMGKTVNTEELFVRDFCSFITDLASEEEVYIRKAVPVYISDAGNVTFDDRVLSYFFGDDWEAWAGKEKPYEALVAKAATAKEISYSDDVRYSRNIEAYVNDVKKCVNNNDVIELFRLCDDEYEAERIITAVTLYDELTESQQELVDAYLRRHVSLTFTDYTMETQGAVMASLQVRWKISEHLPNDRVPESYVDYVASLTDNACYGFTEIGYNVRECVFTHDMTKISFGRIDVSGYNITTYVEEVISNVRYGIITNKDLQ